MKAVSRERDRQVAPAQDYTMFDDHLHKGDCQ